MLLAPCGMYFILPCAMTKLFVSLCTEKQDLFNLSLGLDGILHL